jgi:hypothetical protein
MSSPTDVGVSTQSGNYFPFGHDYGDGYAWNEQANCWIAGQGGRLYALDTTGKVVDEVKIYEHSQTLTSLFRVAQVACTPSGRILYVCEQGTVVNPAQSPQTNWSSLVNTMFCMVTDPLLEANKLNRTALQQAPFNTSGFLTASLTSFVDESATRTERAYLLYYNVIATPNTRITEFNGSTWAASFSTSVGSTTAGAWNVGFRGYHRLIQNTPCSPAFPQGQWRIVGSLGTNTLINVSRLGISLEFAPAQFGSLNPASLVLDNVNTTDGYGFTLFKYSSGSRAGISVTTAYDETLGTLRTFSILNGRLGRVRGFFLTSGTSTNYRFAQAAVTKFGYAVAYQNTSPSAAATAVYVWNNFNSDVPQAVESTTSGSGWVTLYPIDKTTWGVYGPGLDNVYAVAGVPDDVKFFVAIDDNAGNVFFVNNGQSLSIINQSTGLFRSNEVYQIPFGYSVKLRSDTPISIGTLLSIKENI